MAAIPRFGTRVVPERHQIIDEGTCHQTATRFGTPGVTVFGPFFVLPFPTTVVRR